MDILVNTQNKQFMFNLGRIFANGCQIKIKNPTEVICNIKKEEKLGFAKSFNMMIKHWQDNDLKPDIISTQQEENKMFLICPVRNASDNEKTILNNIINKYESIGFDIHYPQRDTNQNPIVNNINTGGYNICLQNAQAIKRSNVVTMYYNRESTGSMFDLGVTFELMQKDKSKCFILENDIELNPNDFIDKKIIEMKSKTPDISKIINKIELNK